MKVGEKNIDHIVYAVPDLKQAMADLTTRLGVAPSFGGYHRDQGTKNALLNLGDGAYLEILAVDEGNTTVSAPRWMGVDVIDDFAITRWSVKGEDIIAEAAALRSFHPQMGQIYACQRQKSDGGLLQWQMTLPLAEPAIEVTPFVTDWKGGTIHPTDSLPAACQLLEIQLVHPKPRSLRSLLKKLDIDLTIEKGATASIKILVDSPQGKVWL